VCQLAIAKEFALPTALVTRGIGSKINKDLLAATMNHAIKDCVINVTISMHHAGEKFDDEDALKENAQVSAIEVVENLQPELSSRQMLLFKEAVADYKKAIETAKARSVSATASRFNISTEQGEKGEDMFGAEAGAEAGGIPATAQ
jgi:hypothetical protein